MLRTHSFQVGALSLAARATFGSNLSQITAPREITSCPTYPQTAALSPRESDVADEMLISPEEARPPSTEDAVSHSRKYQTPIEVERAAEDFLRLKAAQNLLHILDDLFTNSFFQDEASHPKSLLVRLFLKGIRGKARQFITSYEIEESIQQLLNYLPPDDP